ncbi:MAG: glycosyltransferase [Proteobacteria bacterium]|nr:glycosyltransferase [Pseudomonadota bacterium]
MNIRRPFVKVLFITKRLYMSKDLLNDQYGRFYEIPMLLNENGNQVFIVCISYRTSLEADDHCISPLQWRHYKLGVNPFYGLYRYYSGLNDVVKIFQPDIIVGASDSFNVILAAILAKKHKLPYVADLYDNFESYQATLFPGIRTMFARAVKNANGVAVVSDALHEYVCSNYKPQGKVCVVENAIVPDLFHQADKYIARKKLQLPQEGYFIGTAGALYRQRGIGVLFEAFNLLGFNSPQLAANEK